jgi:hypothetical protein
MFGMVAGPMKRTLIAVLAMASACTGPPSPGPVTPLAFRAIREGENATPCVEPPDFIVAFEEDTWIDAFDLQSSCIPGEIMLPRVDFRSRFGVAAWWARTACLGADVRTEVVEVQDGVIRVRASTSDPPGEACANATANLESFLSIPRPDPTIDLEAIEFILDGETLQRLQVE